MLKPVSLKCSGSVTVRRDWHSIDAALLLVTGAAFHAHCPCTNGTLTYTSSMILPPAHCYLRVCVAATLRLSSGGCKRLCKAAPRGEQRQAHYAVTHCISCSGAHTTCTHKCTRTATNSVVYFNYSKALFKIQETACIIKYICPYSLKRPTKARWLWLDEHVLVMAVVQLPVEP
jgi:hypothetical protein